MRGQSEGRGDVEKPLRVGHTVEMGDDQAITGGKGGPLVWIFLEKGDGM